MNVLHRIYALILALPGLIAAEVSKALAPEIAALRADMADLRAQFALPADASPKPGDAPAFLQPGATGIGLTANNLADPIEAVSGGEPVALEPWIDPAADGQMFEATALGAAPAGAQSLDPSTLAGGQTQQATAQQAA